AVLCSVNALTSEELVAERGDTAPLCDLHQIVEGLIGHRLAGKVDSQVANAQHEALSPIRVAAHQLGEPDVGQPNLLERTMTHREDHTERWTPPVVASAP
ncbi:MAG: hypothetical protein RL058_1015, partial [Actinomycetota bacterium]